MTWKEPERKELGLRDLMKGNLETAEFNSLALDRANPKVLYAGAWSNSEPGNSIFKTVDGGKNWKPAGKGVPTEDVRLLLSPAPGTVYALVGDRELYRSADGAATWSPVAGGWGEIKVRTIAADPATAGRLYVATDKGFHRSGDGGKTWSAVALEEDVEAVVVSASGTAYAGTFHGVFKSTDGGATWTNVSAALPNRDVRALAIGGAPPRLYAGIAAGSVWSIELP
jgi:photosystem II stability/assembly factor-like uncharacterized protein